MLTIFLDQETTGLDPARHRVIEIAFQVFDLQDGVLVAEYESVVSQEKKIWEGRDPVSVQINGFTWEKVAAGKPEDTVGEEIIDLLTSIGVKRDSAVFICQNPAFDRAFFGQLVDVYRHERLNWPYHWLDLASMYWMHRIQRSQETKASFPSEMSLSKDVIASYCDLPPEEKPHQAMNGVKHLVRCYDAVVGMPSR